MSRAKLGDTVGNRVGPRSRRVDVTQIFLFPRHVLFMVWTDPQHFARWWGPKEWRAYDCVLDVRPGGRWRSSFSRPGGPNHADTARGTAGGCQRYAACQWVGLGTSANQDTRRTRAIRKDKGLATRIANPLIFLAPRPGLEPGTYGLTVRRSTN